jgi:hypothetical protein
MVYGQLLLTHFMKGYIMKRTEEEAKAMVESAIKKRLQLVNNKKVDIVIEDDIDLINQLRIAANTFLANHPEKPMKEFLRMAEDQLTEVSNWVVIV